MYISHNLLKAHSYSADRHLWAVAANSSQYEELLPFKKHVTSFQDRFNTMYLTSIALNTDQWGYLLGAKCILSPQVQIQVQSVEVFLWFFDYENFWVVTC